MLKTGGHQFAGFVITMGFYYLHIIPFGAAFCISLLGFLICALIGPHWTP